MSCCRLCLFHLRTPLDFFDDQTEGRHFRLRKRNLRPILKECRTACILRMDAIATGAARENLLIKRQLRAQHLNKLKSRSVSCREIKTVFTPGIW